MKPNNKTIWNFHRYGIYLVFFSLLCLFNSCSSDDELIPADVLRAVTAKIQDNNVLRMDIHLDFKTEAAYQIEYWPSDKKENIQTTTLSEKVMQDTKTLIFLTPQTTYDFRVHIKSSLGEIVSDTYSFTTGKLPNNVGKLTLQEKGVKKEIPGYLLCMENKEPGVVTISNMEGRVVWYEEFNEHVKFVTFDTKTQTLACIVGKNRLNPFCGSIIRVIDLYGKKIFERRDEKLLAHHEICRLDNGDLLLVHFVEQNFDLTSRGGSKSEKVTGDGLMVMDIQTGQVKWEWDCFMEFNPADDPNIMGQVNMLNLNYRDDWLHVNSAAQDKNGDFYITLNWSSEIWKISGKDKKVLYRVGNKESIPTAPEDQMQGVHCASVIAPDQILVFDNGRETHISRALTFTVNPSAMTAKVTHRIDVPQKLGSPFQGSAQKTEDDYYVIGPSQSSSILIYDAKGELVKMYNTPFVTYRAIYFKDIKF